MVSTNGVANFEGCNIHENTASGDVCLHLELSLNLIPSPHWLCSLLTCVVAVLREFSCQIEPLDVTFHRPYEACDPALAACRAVASISHPTEWLTLKAAISMTTPLVLCACIFELALNFPPSRPNGMLTVGGVSSPVRAGPKHLFIGLAIHHLKPRRSRHGASCRQHNNLRAARATWPLGAGG